MIDVFQVDAILPQTQCGQCGYRQCLKYAEAILNGEKINRCPPGGDAGIQRLAALLNRPILPLDESCGIHKAFETALIEIEYCIGCKKCIDVCPTDAVIGVHRQLHIVDPEMCNGCGLCVTACPVDCISMIKAGTERTSAMSTKFRLLFQQKNQRNARRAEEKEKTLREQSSSIAKKAFLSSLRKTLK
ncbi:MAG: RnfABCDGE type electron transport complex subunit B [Burkholderiales bacterium]|nr:RnfABCDGE type electron transport complex subunit B [Burkholderiales bacterium]